LWPEYERDAGLERFEHGALVAAAPVRAAGRSGGQCHRGGPANGAVEPPRRHDRCGGFEAAIRDAAKAGSCAREAHALAEALDLYRGPLLPGHYEEWIVPEQERLAVLFSDAAARLVALAGRGGDRTRALEYARRAVAVDPLREERHRDLMRLLAAAGQPEAALRQFRELERLLDQEMGDALGGDARARPSDRAGASWNAPSSFRRRNDNRHVEGEPAARTTLARATDGHRYVSADRHRGSTERWQRAARRRTVPPWSAITRCCANGSAAMRGTSTAKTEIRFWSRLQAPETLWPAPWTASGSSRRSRGRKASARCGCVWRFIRAMWSAGATSTRDWHCTGRSAS
jgi:tetratricopeptide (TPR) repeat protein